MNVRKPLEHDCVDILCGLQSLSSCAAHSMTWNALLSGRRPWALLPLTACLARR